MIFETYLYGDIHPMTTLFESYISILRSQWKITRAQHYYSKYRKKLQKHILYLELFWMEKE